MAVDVKAESCDETETIHAADEKAPPTNTRLHGQIVPLVAMKPGRLFIADAYPGVRVTRQLSAVAAVDREPVQGCRAVVAQVNGSICDLAPIRHATISDGTSNTIFVAERATGISRKRGNEFCTSHGCCFVGNWGDTLFTTFYPPNGYHKVDFPFPTWA